MPAAPRSARSERLATLGWACAAIALVPTTVSAATGSVPGWVTVVGVVAGAALLAALVAFWLSRISDWRNAK